MMIQARNWKTIFFGITLSCVLFLMFTSGCTKRVDTAASAEEEAAPMVTIREFPDVPIPKELKLDKKESFVYTAHEFSTGLLVYDGNVEYDSLVRFFDTSLTKNGWQLRASQKYPRTLLFYQKETKICLINIKDTTLNTHVEIWVTPLELGTYKVEVMEPVEPEPIMP